MKAKNPLCYAGVDSLGNVLSAFVVDEAYPGKTILHLTEMICNRLHIMPCDVDIVSETFGCDIPGPLEKPHTYKLRLSIEVGGVLIQWEAGDGSFVDDEDGVDRYPPDDYEDAKLARDVLHELGIDYRGVRTLGDIDRIREAVGA